MSKIYLCLTWVNHVQVTKAGGKKVTRDESYSELVESQDLLSRVLARARRAWNSDSPQVSETFENYHTDVKETLRHRKEVTRAVVKDGRKLFTYIIRPLKIAFTMAHGTEYIIRDNGKIECVGGTVLKNLAEKAKADSCKSVDKPVDKPIDKPVDKPIDKPVDKPIDKPIDKPVDKPVNKPKGKAKDKPKPVDKPKPEAEPKAETKEPVTPCKHTMESNPQKVAAKVKDDKPTLTKSQLKECEKFNLDPLNLPDDKPKGFKNKIWKAIK
jgi:hypothetical protein